MKQSNNLEQAKWTGLTKPAELTESAKLTKSARSADQPEQPKTTEQIEAGNISGKADHLARRKFNGLLARTGLVLTGLELTGADFTSPSFAGAIGSSKKPTDITIRELRCATKYFAYRTPMKFGGRVLNDITVFEVEAVVADRKGRTALGRGAMTIGNAWAWPSATVSGTQTHDAMTRFGKDLVQKALECRSFGHPLELCHELAEYRKSVADSVIRSMNLSESMPKLAQLNMASPLEAALFDAYGKLHRRNVFDLLGPDFVNRDLSFYLNDDFKGEYPARYTSRTPKKRMPLYHLVGGLDPLSDADLAKRINDGYPETLAEWILADGLTHLKIKLNGNDLTSDVSRMIEVEKITSETEARRGVSRWYYSVDFNEKCPNEEYVLDWLALIGEKSPQARRFLMYIEQPTRRDLNVEPRIEMHRAARLCPVVIDESLVDFNAFMASRKTGYSGVALKACKGLAEAILMGAAAQKYKTFLCVQDLTCPGESFLQSASLAARIPTVAAVEGNAREYCPAANISWLKKYPGIFKIKDGTIETDVLTGPGLGF